MWESDGFLLSLFVFIWTICLWWTLCKMSLHHFDVLSFVSKMWMTVPSTFNRWKSSQNFWESIPWIIMLSLAWIKFSSILNLMVSQIFNKTSIILNSNIYLSGSISPCFSMVWLMLSSLKGIKPSFCQQLEWGKITLMLSRTKIILGCYRLCESWSIFICPLSWGEFTESWRAIKAFLPW